MRIRAVALAMLVAWVGAACGGGGGDAAAPTTATTPTTERTTTTIVTLEAFTTSICAAGRSIADTKLGIAEGYRLTAETYGKVMPTPEKKADLDAFLEANRALAALWSDPNPTTPEAFMQQHLKLRETLDTTIQKVQVECPPLPDVTTTVPAAIAATGRYYSLLRAEGGKGLWWYTSFGCPEGKKVKLGPDLSPVKGQPTAGAVLDEAAGAAEPFTGALANDSAARIGEKAKATCV